MKTNVISIGAIVTYRPYPTCNKVDEAKGKVIEKIDDWTYLVLFGDYNNIYKGNGWTNKCKMNVSTLTVE